MGCDASAHRDFSAAARHPRADRALRRGAADLLRRAPNPKDSKDPKDPKDSRDPKESPNPKDSPGSKDPMDPKDRTPPADSPLSLSAGAGGPSGMAVTFALPVFAAAAASSPVSRADSLRGSPATPGICRWPRPSEARATAWPDCCGRRGTEIFDEAAAEAEAEADGELSENQPELSRIQALIARMEGEESAAE